MKVCLFSEGLAHMRAVTESGITSAYQHLQQALTLAGIDYTEDIRDGFDILHMNLGIGPLSLWYAQYFKKKGKKVIIHAHSTAEDFRQSFRLSEKAMPIIKKTLPLFYGQADLILCPSEYTKKVLKSYSLRNEIVAISNGVDVKRFVQDERKRREYRRSEGIPEDGLLVFCVGHVFKKKGCVDFARIAEAMPKHYFRWFGTVYPELIVDYRGFGNYLKAPPKNLRFTGYFKDILAAYSAGDIFLFPSYDENQGIAILEAASMGKPLVLRDIPVYEGWLEHGENCLKARNNDEFIECIRALAQDEKLRLRLSRNARKLAEENRLEKVGAKLKNIYSELLSHSR